MPIVFWIAGRADVRLYQHEIPKRVSENRFDYYEKCAFVTAIIMNVSKLVRFLVVYNMKKMITIAMQPKCEFPKYRSWHQILFYVFYVSKNEVCCLFCLSTETMWSKLNCSLSSILCWKYYFHKYFHVSTVIGPITIDFRSSYMHYLMWFFCIGVCPIYWCSTEKQLWHKTNMKE